MTNPFASNTLRIGPLDSFVEENIFSVGEIYANASNNLLAYPIRRSVGEIITNEIKLDPKNWGYSYPSVVRVFECYPKLLVGGVATLFPELNQRKFDEYKSLSC